MSSIAYLTDERMLEYHRSKGHREVNFWRIGIRNFDKFEKGDLLFFVDKRKTHPRSKEKGIVGFGVFSDLRTLSIDRTWKDYGEHTGYSSKENFEESIRDMNQGELSDRIQSIYLENVIFFKSPLYMGEFTKPLNRNLESFVYLEDDDEIQLLSKAKSFGVDPWYEMVSEHHAFNNDFDNIEEELSLRQALRNVHVFWTQEQERINNQMKIKKVSNFSYHKTDSSEYEVFIPISSMRNQYYEALGIIRELQTILNLTLKFVILAKENAHNYERKINQFDFLRIEYI